MSTAVVDKTFAPFELTGTPLLYTVADILQTGIGTDQSFVVGYLALGHTFNALMGHDDYLRVAVTDPNAGVRDLTASSTLPRNFDELSRLAALVIPGLREMTPEERRGLRQYYRNAYRKV